MRDSADDVGRPRTRKSQRAYRSRPLRRSPPRGLRRGSAAFSARRSCLRDPRTAVDTVTDLVLTRHQVGTHDQVRRCCTVAQPVGIDDDRAAVSVGGAEVPADNSVGYCSRAPPQHSDQAHRLFSPSASITGLAYTHRGFTATRRAQAPRLTENLSTATMPRLTRQPGAFRKESNTT